MNINWQEIKEKYPKIYQKFIEFILYVLCEQDIDFNNICYCDIEKFFDNHRIYIIPIMILENKWIYRVEHLSLILLYEINNIIYNSRDEAKEQAVLKAFEILNSQLKDKE